MKERQTYRHSFAGKYRSLGIGLAVVVLAGAILVADRSLTEDEVRQSVSGNVQEEDGTVQTDEGLKGLFLKENVGYLEMSTNPLQEVSDPEMEQAVADYYEKLTEKTDFVEGYKNLKLYMKLGKYQNTFVVFVCYDMKIREIYTEVPGLDTLYLEKDKKDSWQVITEITDDEIQECIEKTAGHEDVRDLMEQVQEEYVYAVSGDAILEEALNDLQNAYSR